MDLCSLAELLESGARVVEKHLGDPTTQWLLVELDGGKRLVLVERTYRGGMGVVHAPSDEDLVRFREDPWAAWNATEPDAPGVLARDGSTE